MYSPFTYRQRAHGFFYKQGSCGSSKMERKEGKVSFLCVPTADCVDLKMNKALSCTAWARPGGRKYIDSHLQVKHKCSKTRDWWRRYLLLYIPMSGISFWAELSTFPHQMLFCAFASLGWQHEIQNVLCSLLPLKWYYIWERKFELVLLLEKKIIPWLLCVADIFPSITFANKWHRALCRMWNHFGGIIFPFFFFPQQLESGTQQILTKYCLLPKSIYTTVTPMPTYKE